MKTSEVSRCEGANTSVLGEHVGSPLLHRADSGWKETPEKLHRRARFMINSSVDVMQTTYLTPLPGTRLFDSLQREGRLLYTDYPHDWDRYDMTEVIHRPKNMEPDVLSSIMRESSRRMYSLPTLMLKAVRILLATRSPTASMFAWKSNINYRNVSLGIQV